MLGRWVYYFFRVIQIYKKVIYNIVIELQKTIKKSMARRIVQKLGNNPLWFVRKNYLSKMKRKV